MHFFSLFNFWILKGLMFTYENVSQLPDEVFLPGPLGFATRMRDSWLLVKFLWLEVMLVNLKNNSPLMNVELHPVIQCELDPCACRLRKIQKMQSDWERVRLERSHLILAAGTNSLQLSQRQTGCTWGQLLYALAFLSVVLFK